MPFRYVVQAVQNTPGTQDFTVSGIGTDIKGCEVWGTSCTTAGTVAAGARLWYGATDGTNQYCCAMSSRDARTITDVWSRGTQTALLGNLSPIDGSWQMQAVFDSFITNGVRIDVTTPAVGTFVAIMRIWYGAEEQIACGYDVNAEAKTFTLGFTPNYLTMFGHGIDFDDTAYEEIYYFFHRHASIDALTQDAATYTAAIWESDAQADGSPNAIVVTVQDVVGYADNGFTAEFFDEPFAYFARNSTRTDDRVVVFAFDTPTTALTHSLTPADFTPDGIGLTCMHVQSTDTIITSNDAGTMSIGGATASEQCCANITIEDAAATTNTSGVVDATRIIRADNDDQTTGIRATLNAFHDRGAFLDWSDVLGAARKGIGFAIGTGRNRVRVRGAAQIKGKVQIKP